MTGQPGICTEAALPAPGAATESVRLSRRRTGKSNISRGNRANVIDGHHAMSSLPGVTPVNTACCDLSDVQCRRSEAESQARIIPPPPTEPGEHPSDSHTGDRSRCRGSENELDQGQQQRISHSRKGAPEGTLQTTSGELPSCDS